jgi:hypothetical protein
MGGAKRLGRIEFFLRLWMRSQTTVIFFIKKGPYLTHVPNH